MGAESYGKAAARSSPQVTLATSRSPSSSRECLSRLIALSYTSPSTYTTPHHLAVALCASHQAIGWNVIPRKREDVVCVSLTSMPPF